MVISTTPARSGGGEEVSGVGVKHPVCPAISGGGEDSGVGVVYRVCWRCWWSCGVNRGLAKQYPVQTFTAMSPLAGDCPPSNDDY